LQAMYPIEFRWRTTDGKEPDLTAPEAVHPSFAIDINDYYTLEVTLTSSYPDGAKPTVYLACDGEVATATRKEARKILETEVVAQEPGCECLDLLVQALMERLADVKPCPVAYDRGGADAVSLSEHVQSVSGHQSQDREMFKTVLLWSHHLLATSKRKDIVSWSRELRLAGYSRPGHPGAILIEGAQPDVDEFVSRIKALRWQALQVRGEEVRASRRLNFDGDGVSEVEGLGDIVEKLRKKDQELATWFLEGMKIGRG